MKLDSEYFDCIRVKPDEDRLARRQLPKCEWKGCDHPATHPAPRGRGQEGQYHHFCIDHVRQYNKSYNYFAGMSDDDVVSHQKSDVTGQRPTWTMGVNRWGRNKASATARPSGFAGSFNVDDPFGLFRRDAGQGARPAPEAEIRPIRNAERKCLSALDLDTSATPRSIKARFKELVKRLHPDHNGGDRGAEDKLREVIQAYNYLKQAGLC
ncbi:MAG: J domain-containing protein [Pseudomonadota bacterium]|nr:J domain-containing protein [Pseudomonadota bacterium]